ncbi:MAG: hypothetical protein ACAI44_39725 [Candidatus Sericytochromatia bacterium]
MSYISVPSSFILEATRDQWGSTATLWDPSPKHAYGWNARVPGSDTPKPIDVVGYSEKKYGQDWRVVLTHMGPDGWAWFNPFREAWQLQPVLLIAREFRWEAAQVNWGIQNLEANVRYVRDWYRSQLGKSFRILDRTQIIDCGKSAQSLIDLARSSAEPGKRFDFLYWCRDTYAASVRRTSPNILYVIATLTGNHPDEDYGAAATSNYCAVSSFASSVKIDPAAPTAAMKRIAYALGHEGGHCLGLPHPDAALPDAPRSIMLWGEPPAAIFIAQEKQLLANSPYLFQES